MKSYAANFTNLFPLFDVDSEEVPLQLQMELIDLQGSEDLKLKFLAYHIFDFSKNHVLQSGSFPNIINHTGNVVNVFRIPYRCEQLLSKNEAYQMYTAFKTV